MRITKKSGYGLIAMVNLAEKYEFEPVSTRELSERYDLPRPFLEKILRKLKEEKLVEVKRGRGGGYKLGRRPSDISVRQVVCTLEGGNIAPVNCLLDGKDNDCHLEDNCPTEEFWKEVKGKIIETMESVHLSDLA